MANSFYRIRQSLRADTGIKSVAALLIALLLVTAWLVWASHARVTRYELSQSARLELDGAAYPVQANASGELIASTLILGKEVHSGDVLAELDDRKQRLALQQERIHLASLEPQLVALRSANAVGRPGQIG